MTPVTLALWRMIRKPKSRWRVESRRVIDAVINGASAETIGDDAALLKAVDAAYPFGSREMLPYKMWLLERKLFIEACAAPAPPAPDEAGACEVAGDLVELGRIDEAHKLLEERAPNRLSRDCRVCGAKPGKACVALVGDAIDRTAFDDAAYRLIVPHLSRVGLHGRDVSPGPLFEGASK